MFTLVTTHNGNTNDFKNLVNFNFVPSSPHFDDLVSSWSAKILAFGTTKGNFWGKQKQFEKIVSQLGFDLTDADNRLLCSFKLILAQI